MSSQYLIRLDDACSTMNRQNWALVERALDQAGVKPIVAVVPDNHDPALVFDEEDIAFWDKVREWQTKGWTVAMHGHTHVMHPTDHKLLVPYYKRSEFAGLSAEAQRAKIRAAWQLFLAQGIVPEVWVGPAHSFDLLTLRAIREETSIRVVSDGIAWNTFYEHDFHWIPQQLWALADRRSGLWTVCLHPNQMDERAIGSFAKALEAEFRGRLTCFKEVTLSTRPKSLVGRLYHEYFWWRWRNSPQEVSR
jgi:predicted deacetylase